MPEDGAAQPANAETAHTTAEEQRLPEASSPILAQTDRVARLEQKLDSVLQHVSSSVNSRAGTRDPRDHWNPASLESSTEQHADAVAPMLVPAKSYGAPSSVAPPGRRMLDSFSSVPNAGLDVRAFSLQRSLTAPHQTLCVDDAAARSAHGVRLDAELMSLQRAGFVAESSDDAVEKWLEERFIGPEVHERSWSEFGSALKTCQAPFVLCSAVFWDVLHPQGWVRTRWDICMLLLLAYVCVAAPFIICFAVDFARFSALGCVELAVDVGFALDILLNFRTGFLDEGKLVVNRSRIAKSYLTHWFVVDVISVLPFQEMLTSDSLGFVQLLKGARVIKLAKILRLLRIVKMLRVLKVGDLVSKMEGIVGKSVIRVTYLMAAAVLVTHIVACLFYYTAYLDGLSEDTWVALSGLEDSGVFESYITALYWSMSTLCTVGYGDVTPGNAKERIVAMIGMVIGVTVFGYFMGAMGSMLSKMGNTDAAASQYMVDLQAFLKTNAVPKKLATRTTAFMRYVLHRRPLHASSELLNGAAAATELSTPLKTEIVMHMHRDTIRSVPFLRDKDPQFVVALVTMLRLQYFAPGDVIVRQGEAGDTILFVTKGDLEVRWYYNSEEQDFSDEDIAFKALMHKLPMTAPEDGCRVSDAELSASSGRWHKPSRVRPSDDGQQGRPARDVEVPTHLDAAPVQALTWNRYRLIGVQPEGSYFGEHTCLLGEKRVATVVAVTFCELHSLSRLSLEKMAQQWPELISEILQLLDGTALDYVKADATKFTSLPRSGTSSLAAPELNPALSSMPLHNMCTQNGHATTNLKALTMEHMAQVRVQMRQGVSTPPPICRQSAARYVPKNAEASGAPCT